MKALSVEGVHGNLSPCNLIDTTVRHVDDYMQLSVGDDALSDALEALDPGQQFPLPTDRAILITFTRYMEEDYDFRL